MTVIHVRAPPCTANSYFIQVSVSVGVSEATLRFSLSSSAAKICAIEGSVSSGSDIVKENLIVCIRIQHGTTHDKK